MLILLQEGGGGRSKCFLGSKGRFKGLDSSMKEKERVGRDKGNRALSWRVQGLGRSKKCGVRRRTRPGPDRRNILT